ncbi:hypothetical protein RE428_35600 [Marinobacter nanhaiticus D15-8W]|nr:hypothetical protein RE428_35600 [Marinobacter nanhaiticus D15-8W]
MRARKGPSNTGNTGSPADCSEAEEGVAKRSERRPGKAEIGEKAQFTDSK